MFRPGSNTRRLGGLIVAVSVLFAPHAAHAQDLQVASLQGVEIASFLPAVAAAAAHDAMLDSATPIETPALVPTLMQRIAVWRGGFASWRNENRVMFPLYTAQVGLQLLDIHSTTRALNAGASEGNAVMSRMAGSPAALLFVKAGATASTIYLTEKLRKRNRVSRVAAVAAMVGVDSVYALIVAHNYRSAH
jgi:hypothetical protein